MTPTPDIREVLADVTQADRDMAAYLVRIGAPGCGNGNKVIASGIKGGLHDSYEVVQVFARHRLTTALTASTEEG